MHALSKDSSYRDDSLLIIASVKTISLAIFPRTSSVKVSPPDRVKRLAPSKLNQLNIDLALARPLNIFLLPLFNLYKGGCAI